MIGGVDCSSPSTSGPLLAIFDIVDKSALDQHCRTAVIHGSDLANLIWACQIGAIPIAHMPIFRHHHPRHLEPTDDDLRALVENGVGPLSKEARKFANKVGQMLEQRRLFNGHLFLPVANPGEWHFFYFDQRDTDPHSNHWDQGEHIHLINMVTHPRVPVVEFVRKIEAEDRPKLGGGFHIRYRDCRSPEE